MPLPGFALRRTVPEVDGEFPAAAGRPKAGAWLRRALLSLPPDLILVSSYDFMVAPWSAARILHFRCVGG